MNPAISSAIRDCSPLIVVVIAGMSLLLSEVLFENKSRTYQQVWTQVALGIALALTYWLWKEMPGNAGSFVHFNSMLVVDRPALVTWGIILLSSIIAMSPVNYYLESRGINRGEFYALVLLAIAGAMVVCSSIHFMSFFLGLETLSIALYVLVTYDRGRTTSVEAGMKYFILGAFSTAFLLFGIALLYGQVGQMSFAALGQWVRGTEEYYRQPLFVVGSLFVLIGLAFKVAAVPFHIWTPDVYQGAPGPVTGLMAAIVKVAGFLVLLRILDNAFGLADTTRDWFAPLIFILAVITMILGNVAAVVQNRIKRLLAFSSIAHAGYLLAALIALPEVPRLTWQAIIFYLLVYGVTAAATFGLLSLLEDESGEDESGEVDIMRLEGLGQKSPWLAGLLAVFMLTLAGIPPTGGFLAKVYLLQGILAAGEYGLAIVMVLASVVGVYYYLRVIVAMYMEKPGRDVVPVLSIGQKWLPAVTAVIVIVLGLFPDRVIRAFQLLGQ